ncbi:MAG TPA: hypothetical protein VE444_04240 [Gaiellaceae bacterium]|jgi:hypothetical protein|nr:hypothetical protein [Gaiellaceae bacterium]
MDGKARLVQLHGPETAQRIQAIDRIETLVAQGKSRLAATRIVEIERGNEVASRARRHVRGGGGA